MARPRKYQLPADIQAQTATASATTDPAAAPAIPSILEKAAEAATVGDSIRVLNDKINQLDGLLKAADTEKAKMAEEITVLKGQVSVLRDENMKMSDKSAALGIELHKAGVNAEAVSKNVEIVDTVSLDKPYLVKTLIHEGKEYKAENDKNGYARYRVPPAYALSLIFCGSPGRFLLCDHNHDMIMGKVPAPPYMKAVQALRHYLVMGSRANRWVPYNEPEKD